MSLVRFIPRYFFVSGAIVNRINSLISLYVASLLCIGMQPISVHWFYILQLCWIHESILAVFLWNILGLPYRVSCHLWRVKVWLPPGRFGWLLFFCVVWLQRLRLDTVLNNSGESGHPCLVPDLRGKTQFFPIEDDISCGLFINDFYDV